MTRDCICNCGYEPPERLEMVEGERYKLRDGRIGKFLLENKGEYMFVTSVRTAFYSTKLLEGMERVNS